MMSVQADKLKNDLDRLFREWMSGDEGRVLIAPTKADVAAVESLVAEADLADLTKEVAIVVANAIGDAIEGIGARPADYWRLNLGETVAKRLSKTLANPSAEFTALVQGTLKGRG
jgi:hypothetical protein